MRQESGAALLAHLQADPGLSAQIKTFQKLNALVHWNDMAAHLKPALTVVSTDSEAHGGWGKPNNWHLGFTIYVYTQTNAADGGAQNARDAILDAVDAALRQQPGLGRQTLSGAVFDCIVDGKTETDHAVTGAHGIGWMPVLIRPLG